MSWLSSLIALFTPKPKPKPSAPAKSDEKLAATPEPAPSFEQKLDAERDLVFTGDFARELAETQAEAEAAPAAVEEEPAPIEKDPVPEVAETLFTSAVVNFRTAPSTSSATIGVLNRGCPVIVLDRSTTGWIKVEIGGKPGYVSASYLTATEPKPEPTPAPAAKATVTPEHSYTNATVNFRAGAATSTAILEALTKGTKVTVLDRSNSSWTKVIANGKTGYISATYLSKTVKVDLLEAFVTEARRWIGVTEKGGNNSGPEVEMFQKAVDGKAVKEAWCASFMQYCIKEVAKRFGVAQAVASTEHCMTLWNMSKTALRSATPKVGYLVVWNHKGTANGHIGVVTRIIDSTTFEALEGNTGPGSGVEREGDGVYLKIRSIHGAGNMLVKGYVKPFDPEVLELK